jgi:hypothetical protein
MRRRPVLLIVGLMAVLLAGAAVAAAAAPVRVGAVLTGRTQPKLRLRITRDGRTVYDQPVRSHPCSGFCVAVKVPPSKSPLFVGNLGNPGGPAVVLGLYTGGAHCCFVDQAFAWDARRHVIVETQHNFLDAGALIQHLGGRVVFKSADARIAEDALTDYADSGAPLQIWRFSGRRFIDITHLYPALVTADAARWMAAFKHHVRNGVGFIAAWAADEDVLGNSHLVATTLASLAHQNKLHAAPGLSTDSEHGFVTAITHLLRQLGYTK